MYDLCLKTLLLDRKQGINGIILSLTKNSIYAQCNKVKVVNSKIPIYKYRLRQIAFYSESALKKLFKIFSNLIFFI